MTQPMKNILLMIPNKENEGWHYLAGTLLHIKNFKT